MSQSQELEHLKKAHQLLVDERDGLKMRCDAYEGKIGALERNVHLKEKSIANLKAQAVAADRLAMKVIRMVFKELQVPRYEISEEAGNSIIEQMESEGVHA